ncbi:hypothetical protein MKW98_026373 [Papaver atlanticum]|uniref:ABC1 atypical kinase-like domain-containing protein n=1 Tax=Papaver atlanticum TaxID=357466 RepID=A0AAD4SP03_9MAGN|nr:hypothetical protein MKW98_026373 [Papaver atlanticum]
MSCVVSYTSSTSNQDFTDAIAIYPDLSNVRLSFLLPTRMLPFSEVSKIFAEMIYRHGCVHCDPHAANCLFSLFLLTIRAF